MIINLLLCWFFGALEGSYGGRFTRYLNMIIIKIPRILKISILEAPRNNPGALRNPFAGT